MNVYIGIDPGAREAGIGVLDVNGNYVSHYRLTDWTPYQFKDLMNDIRIENGVQLATIEKVGTMPGQGIASSGKFMKATGIMIGVLVGLGIPFIEIAPQTWKKLSPTLASPKGESVTDKKKRSLAYIQQRYPEANLTKAIEHNVADALCIAEWVWLRNKK